MSPIIIAIVVFFIAGLIIISSGSTDGLLFGLLLAGPSGIILGCMILNKIKIILLFNRNIILTDAKDGHIKLNKRTISNRQILKPSKERFINIKDHPAELVYTGVTIGGVTTGGFHVNEAYQTASLGEATGVYHLYLRGITSDTLIRTIEIPPDMVDSAKADPIVSQFLNGTTITLKHNDYIYIPEIIRESAASLQRSGNYNAAFQLLRPYTGKQELTKKECKAIIAWMSNKNK